MSRWNLGWILGMLGVSLLGISLTHSAPSREGKLGKKHENIKLLVDVLEEVQGKYVKELDAEKMRELVENMITSGLERLDPHSSFINPDEYKQFQKQSKGRFGGIGIRIGLDRNTQIYVETPMVGTPAYEAGVLAGDYILKIDGKTTENMSMKKIVEQIQGEPGTDVVLTVLHEGSKKEEDIKITRAEIAVDSILGDQRMKENLKEWNFWIDPDSRIAYIRLAAFTETTVADLTKVVDGLQKANMRGLIIDLRNNPGGLLRAAVEVSSLFLPEGKNVVTTKTRNNQREEVYNAKPVPNIAPGSGGSYPVAILMNRYSASASEIVAAALQDHLRAVIIGERSFGKGSVQNVIPMESGQSALKLTTASYWRPNNKNIHRFPESKDEDDWGVKPSPGYEVKLSDEERIEYFRYRRERDIVRKSGEAPKVKDEKDQNKKPFRDRVLDKAVEYVKGEIEKQNKNKNAQGLPAPGAIQPQAIAEADRRTPGYFAQRAEPRTTSREERLPIRNRE